ncbi:hypothetical protein AVEN_80383-1 [Araneus ventricosus]|uniref:CCHC-type domain-containing protein n=1 Tax=Araneus ventricosus TaxID=182803 RepID=A0A4Y2UT74_ARAVE|nr:hypothetical protein AVEN_80383-1 [Araneus ventricosus]
MTTEDIWSVIEIQKEQLEDPDIRPLRRVLQQSYIGLFRTPYMSRMVSFIGVISCGELLNEPVEKITELKSQGVIHVRRITIRRDGQLLNTKRLNLTFDSNKLPEYIKAGYMRLSVRTYIPNPLRCFKCQRFGHSKTSCSGTLTCARCAEVGHESTDCTRTEKCVNCKGEHTSFSRNCFAWKQEKEIITTKIKKQISYQEARKLVKSQTPTPGNSYVSVAKKSISAPSADRNKDISTVSISKLSDSTNRASSPITNTLISSSPSVAPVSEAVPRRISLILNLFQTEKS